MNVSPDTSASDRRKPDFRLVAFAALAIVAAVYWPLKNAGLIWDDKIIFRNNAWLSYGNDWRHFLFHGFYEWENYFRPLGVALFTFEARFLQAAPGPMHMVSLAIHLLNTLLVGMLAVKLCASPRSAASGWFPALAMVLYGLHPALLEPVAWISAQFELLLTLFVLLGLLAHLSILRPGLRATCVASCFFLAACAKETAIAMPALLLLVDLTRQSRGPEDSTLAAVLRAIWLREKLVYLLVMAAGIAYLALRHWAMGYLILPASHESLPVLQRLQTVCFVYMQYLRIIIWPMRGLSPLHIVDTHRFAMLSVASAATDAAAILILAAAVVLALRRKTIGFLLLAVTAALFPALHVIPVAFEDNLYHERYAMLAIAVACAWLPELASKPSRRLAPRVAALVGIVAATGWLALAIVNIVATLPLWSDETKLWQWTLAEQPDSIEAKVHLLSTYIDTNDPRGTAFADQIIAENVDCATCWLDAAFLALAKGDTSRAEVAVRRLQRSPFLAYGGSLLAGYTLATGQLLELQHDPVSAEQAFRTAITMEPFDPQPVMQLALLYAHQRRLAEARVALSKALALFPPDERPAHQRDFDRALAHPYQVPESPNKGPTN